MRDKNRCETSLPQTTMLFDDTNLRKKAIACSPASMSIVHAAPLPGILFFQSQEPGQEWPPPLILQRVTLFADSPHVVHATLPFMKPTWPTMEEIPLRRRQS